MDGWMISFVIEVLSSRNIFNVYTVGKILDSFAAIWDTIHFREKYRSQGTCRLIFDLNWQYGDVFLSNKKKKQKKNPNMFVFASSLIFSISVVSKQSFQ